MGNELLIPYVADGGGYRTQLILYSGTPGQFGSGSLRFVSQSGQPFALVAISTRSCCSIEDYRLSLSRKDDRNCLPAITSIDPKILDVGRNNAVPRVEFAKAD